MAAHFLLPFAARRAASTSSVIRRLPISSLSLSASGKVGGDWYVQLLLLMPDHLHGLVSFPEDRAMKSVISSWKEFLARKAGVSWQRDFFDHRVRDDESFLEKANYIRMNPVRKNLVAEAGLWPFVWQPD